MTQRERDAAMGSMQRELQVVRDNAEKEMSSSRKTYEAQLATLRTARDEAVQLGAQLSEEKARFEFLLDSIGSSRCAQTSRADQAADWPKLQRPQEGRRGC